MNSLSYKIFYERNLPHYQPLDAMIFITFRLAGSLPLEFLRRLESQARQMNDYLLSVKDQRDRSVQKSSAQWDLFTRWDFELNSGRNSPSWLYIHEVGDIVSQAIHYLDGKKYSLEAFCIMPNHVHMVITPLSVNGEVHTISEIMQSLKGFTARKANQCLNRKGECWQSESFDHVIRSNQEFIRIIEYVGQNPVKASLEAKWVYRRE